MKGIYSGIVKKFADEPQTIRKELKNVLTDPECYLRTLPPYTLLKVILPTISLPDFELTRANLGHVMTFYIEKQMYLGENSRANSLSKELVMALAPYLISHQLRPLEQTNQFLRRVKILANQGVVDRKFCGNLVSYFELMYDGQKEFPQKIAQLLSQSLTFFGTTEERVDYRGWAISFLYQTIGGILYQLRSEKLERGEVYERMKTNRKQITFLIKKIKDRPLVLGAILSHITVLRNNQTDDLKQANILIMFQLFRFWKVAKQEGSLLNKEQVMDVWAEAFHRQMFVLYGYEARTKNNLKLYLKLLTQTQIQKEQKILERISYHLLALHKLYISTQNMEIAQKIEKLWKIKFYDVKMNDLYLGYCPIFIKQNQKQSKPIDEDQRSIRVIKFSQTLKSSRKSRQPSMAKNRGKTLHFSWINSLVDEIKRFDIEKLYLLLEGFWNFIATEYTIVKDRPNTMVLKIVITILKKLQKKKHIRFGSGLLVDGISYELQRLIKQCDLVNINLKYEQSVVGLGLFELCSLQKSQGSPLSVEKIVRLHRVYNYQENLQTYLNLKSIEESIEMNIFIDNLGLYQSTLSDNSFQSKLYRLFRVDAKNNKMKETELLGIAHLLSLKSINISKNILVNYAYSLFQNDKEGINRHRIQAFSDFMNSQIEKEGNQEIIILFLRLINIFEEFDTVFKEQSYIERHHLAIAKNFFRFLMRHEHRDYYSTYAYHYQKLGYIKEAIFFIELHNSSLSNNQKSEEIKKKAIELYAKIDSQFSRNLPFITKYGHLLTEWGEKQMQNEINQLEYLVITGFDRAERYLESLNFELFNEGKATFENWRTNYQPLLNLTISKICQLNQSASILQHFIVYDIISQMIYVKQRSVLNQQIAQKVKKNIFIKVQALKNGQSQLIFHKIILNYLNCLGEFQKVQQIYLEQLLQLRKKDEFLGYLAKIQKKVSGQIFDKKYKPYMIKYHYLNKDYSDALSLISNQYNKYRKQVDMSEINQIALESKYMTQLNFTLFQCLEFLKQSCLILLMNDKNKQKYFDYFLKMCRMIFQRYRFSSAQLNQKLLDLFFKYIDLNSSLMKGTPYLQKTIFYMLRFILEKFYYNGNSSDYGQHVVNRLKGLPNILVPYCDYLIRKISKNQEKNEIIYKILLHILVNNTSACIWTISFLKNYQQTSQYRTSQMSQQRIIVNNFYSKIWKQVCARASFNDLDRENLNYLTKMSQMGFSHEQQRQIKMKRFETQALPRNLSFVFFPEFYIDSIRTIKMLGNGKSNPIQIVYRLKKKENSEYKLLTVIIKKVEQGAKHYRIQSNAACFFKDCDLIDQATTYRIFHLGRNVVLVEYVNNIGTLKSVLHRNFPDVMKVEKEVIGRQTSQNHDKRPLKVYDEITSRAVVPLSSLIMAKSISIADWWNKYTNFVRTLAQWSLVGYIIGLGDRHLDNIMISQDFKLIHIDFEYTQDIGLSLPYPEWVPFRLTNCLVEPLGCLGEFGLLYSQMIRVTRKIEVKEQHFWKALSNLVDQSDNNIIQQIIERAKFETPNSKLSEDGVAQTIIRARNPELLRRMFNGWSSFF